MPLTSAELSAILESLLDKSDLPSILVALAYVGKP